jgi:hypothetical protein
MPVGPSQNGVSLHLFQDVTLDIRRQQRNSLLLLVFAGISTLVSSALLRPVLKAGLRPLEELSDRLEQIEFLLERKEAALAQARRHIRMKTQLELWLYVHVPVTIALLAALLAHIVSVFLYW